jgi:hypothetical protein
MKRAWIVGGVVVAVAAAVGGAVAVTSGSTASRSDRSGTRASVEATPVTIDRGTSEVFSPPSAATDQDPSLTSRQAWDEFTASAGSKGVPMPSDMTVKLGSLTQTDHAANTLTYGFSEPPARCPGLMTHSPQATCVHWTFVDADTGQLIDRTYQVVSGDLTTFGKPATAAIGTVVGTFLAVGGPPGAPIDPQRGDVFLRANHHRAIGVTVGPDGRFSIAAGGGTYALYGRTPQFNINGREAICRALHPIRVRPHGTTHANIYCQRR